MTRCANGTRKSTRKATKDKCMPYKMDYFQRGQLYDKNHKRVIKELKQRGTKKRCSKGYYKKDGVCAKKAEKYY